MDRNRTDSPAFSPLSQRMRRTVFVCLFGTVLLCGLATMLVVVAPDGVSALEACATFLFALAFGYISYNSVNALLGFVVRATCRDPLGNAAPPVRRAVARLPADARVAIVMPVYNEDAERVATGLHSTLASLALEPSASQFDLHLLSDSTNDAIAEAEALAADALREEFAGRIAVHYRRRADNTGAKVGNLAEFCDRCGDDYRYMLVLDADSIMSGELIDQLARIIEGTPHIGIVQTVPLAVAQTTLHGRFLQFAHRLSAQLLCLGQCWWQGNNGLYFGHNAIIRLAPFIEHCKLPILPGKGPLSGPVMSHDFLEAAMLRGAGYEVWHIPVGEGSYEQLPTNVLDSATRERRWSQGNLQHLFLVGMPGLTFLSRVQLVVGAMSYVCSAAWFLTLLVGIAMATVDQVQTPVYFRSSMALLPDWPVVKYREAISLGGVTLVMLLLPKLLGTLTVLASAERRRRFGGGVAVLITMAGEVVFSALLAPVMMLFHVRFMASLLAGHSTGWSAQPRDGRGLSITAAARDLWLHLLVGVIMAASVWSISPSLLAWFGPVLTGLLLSPVLASMASREPHCTSALQLGLLHTPEDASHPQELVALERLQARRSAALRGAASGETDMPVRAGLAIRS